MTRWTGWVLVMVPSMSKYVHTSFTQSGFVHALLEIFQEHYKSSYKKFVLKMIVLEHCMQKGRVGWHNLIFKKIE